MYKKHNGTPIFRAEHEYHLSKGKWGKAARGKLLQFPLVLMYALTSHKMQVNSYFVNLHLDYCKLNNTLILLFLTGNNGKCWYEVSHSLV